jgi:hypothetical protein
LRDVVLLVPIAYLAFKAENRFLWRPRGGYRTHPREMTDEIRDNGQLDWSHLLAVEEGNDVTIPASDRRLDRHAAQWIWHGPGVVSPGSVAGVAAH